MAAGDTTVWIGPDRAARMAFVLASVLGTAAVRVSAQWMSWLIPWSGWRDHPGRSPLFYAALQHEALTKAERSPVLNEALSLCDPPLCGLRPARAREAFLSSRSGALLLEATAQSWRSRTAKLWPLVLHPLTTLLLAWLFKELLTKEEVVDGQQEACRAAQTRRRGLECMAARAPEDPSQLIQGGPDPGEP